LSRFFFSWPTFSPKLVLFSECSYSIANTTVSIFESGKIIVKKLTDGIFNFVICSAQRYLQYAYWPIAARADFVNQASYAVLASEYLVLRLFFQIKLYLSI